MRPGDVVDSRFELEALAGSGGMGEVFRARDRDSGEIVAVKILLDPYTAGRTRFLREARMLADLSHPGIVRHIAHGAMPSGEPYLAMEWLEGEDLRARMIREGLTTQETITLVTRVAEALGAAHAQGIVHRDLKPTNLFLPDRRVDQVKLLDFGIAQLGGRTRVTQSGVLLGTPGYMAPEQARSGQDLDPRADVFTLGCVTFECLTGKPAFSGDNLMAVLAKILFEEPPRVRDLRSGVPADLDMLVARMLSKDPDGRPRDGAAVAEALHGLGTPGGLMDSMLRASRPPALTAGERRTLSVVLIGRGPSAAASAPLITDKTAVSSVEDALRQEAKSFGGRLEHLADGSVAVTVVGNAMATDQTAQAARCALALRKLAQGRPIALSTGRGELTSRMPTGDAIDRAARTLSRRAARLARASAEEHPPIALDEVTAGLLDARFEVRDAEDGLWLIGEREIADGARTLLGKPTACVGRDWELATLVQHWADCIEEPVARAVLVTAPAGMGKSRLAHELMSRVRQRRGPASIWVGRGDSLRAGSAFGVLAPALRSAVGIRDGEPLEERREKLHAAIARRVPPSDARRVTEFLGELVGTPFPDDDSVPLRSARRDASLMGEQMRRAFVDFLAAECAAQPVLIVLEDLHWGDLPTVRSIDLALRELRDQPWMVLALGRPEVHKVFPTLWADRGVQEILLKELTRKASERLARQVLGNGVSRAVIERLVAQADGNAFYLEELIRAVAERRGEALPETVVAMVESRLSGLDGDARRALRAASIFGEVFWPGGVFALVGRSADAMPLRDRLALLVERELLVHRSESRFPGETELAFRHALLREGSYATLTAEDRTLGHQLAGEWLLAHGESDPLVLAEHFERGGEAERAGTYYLRAVEQAHRAGDTDATIARARRALSCGVPEDVRVALLGMLSVAYVYRPASLLEAAPYIEEVMSLAKPGTAPWAQAASARLVGAMHRGERAIFMDTLRLVEEAEPAPEAIFPLTLALINGILTLDAWGQPEAGARVLRRAHEIVSRVAAEDPMAAGLLDIIHAQRAAYADEDPWEALRRARMGEERLKEANHRRGAAIGKAYIGMNLWFLGALDQAAEALRSVTSADEEMGNIIRSQSLSGALADLGAVDEALVLARQIVESATTKRHRMDEGRGRWALADVLRRQGNLNGALEEALIAVDLLASVPLDQIAASATLAAILLALGRAREALATAERAMARYASIGACGFFRGAFLRLVHAESLEAIGDHAAAQKAIAVARERLFASAAKIGDPDQRRAFLESVPENARTLELARRWLDEPAACQP